MQINFMSEPFSVRLSESEILRDGCYYTRPTDDSETFVIGLDVITLFQIGSNLFRLLRQWTSSTFHVPFGVTGRAILINGNADFGMSIQATCNNDQWSYSLTLVGIVDNKTESASFEILSFTPAEQRLMDRYVGEISEAVERGRGRVIANVANAGA